MDRCQRAAADLPRLRQHAGARPRAADEHRDRGDALARRAGGAQPATDRHRHGRGRPARARAPGRRGRS